MKGKYQIGEVSKLLGLTSQALRYYEQHNIIAPTKSENGTRYYSAYDVHRLISFRKYRNVDFAIQDIVDYMRNHSLADRAQWLKSKGEELLVQSKKTYERYLALSYYQQQTEIAVMRTGIFERCMRPDYVIQTVFWTQSTTIPQNSLDNIRAFIDAMPVTNLCFLAEDSNQALPHYQMGAEYKIAFEQNLPMTDTFRLAPIPCVSTCLICPSDYDIQPALSHAAFTAQEQGYKLNDKEKILCILITADTSQPVYKTFILAYLPILL